MDLNQLPPYFDFDFLDVEAAIPCFCTQTTLSAIGLESYEQIKDANAQVQIADDSNMLAAALYLNF